MASPSANVQTERTQSERPARLSALKMLQPPRWARFFAVLLLIILIVSPVALFLVPWQQNLAASGRVIAFDPTERQQEVEAPVDGRILRWHVKEGQFVRGPVLSEDGRQVIRPGDKLVSIQDPDPDLPRRLALQKEAVRDRQKAARERIEAYSNQISNLERSRERSLAAISNRLKVSERQLDAAGQSVRVASLQRELAGVNFRMEERLIKEGLTSQLNFLSAQQRRDATLAEEIKARNTEAAARSSVAALREDVERVRNDANAGISSARANRQSAEAELAAAARDLAEIEVRIARQSTQEVTAPCDGTVYRVLANSSSGGAIVKQGERLVVITPRIKDDSKRMVELYVEGNDAPQLTELWRQRLADDDAAKIKVRLQFEGWPAIQTVGWPTTAVGTYGGRVVFVDPHDDGKGRFRILVEQDPDDERWPNDFLLRQGARVQGWLLLGEVSIGYELWRRFNGFPPVVLGKDSDKPAKPAKVKVPK